MEKNRSKKKKKHILLKICSGFFILLFLYVIIFNNRKTVVFTEYVIEKNADGQNEITVVHLSDTHFPRIKADTVKLAENIAALKPDIIALTGDIIDYEADNSGVEIFLDLIDDICPVYYVYGNHEMRNPDTDAKMVKLLQNLKVRLLKNEFEKLELYGQSVTVAGITAKGGTAAYGNFSYNTQSFAEAGNGGVKILLAHHPEDFDKYTHRDNLFLPDLILSGHAHGGGIRFPFLGGLIAPNQGLFPKYTDGLYVADSGASMVVSRGIGLSVLPVRVNNKPDVPVIKISF